MIMGRYYGSIWAVWKGVKLETRRRVGDPEDKGLLSHQGRREGESVSSGAASPILLQCGK
jgi:hypothetical protein